MIGTYRFCTSTCRAFSVQNRLHYSFRFDILFVSDSCIFLTAQFQGSIDSLSWISPFRSLFSARVFGGIFLTSLRVSDWNVTRIVTFEVSGCNWDHIDFVNFVAATNFRPNFANFWKFYFWHCVFGNHFALHFHYFLDFFMFRITCFLCMYSCGGAVSTTCFKLANQGV